MVVVISNLTEALNYFIQNKTKENIELDVQPLRHDISGNPVCYIIQRRHDKKYYFLFYRESILKRGFDRKFDQPGMGDRYLVFNIDAIKSALFEYDGAAIAIVASDGQIEYVRAQDVYNFCTMHNTVTEMDDEESR